MAVLEFLQEILSNASILVGLLALIGLLVARASLPDVVTGTLKTIIGFLILGGGANILIGALDPLGTMISEGLGLQGVVPTNEAIVALAQEDFGAETAGIMGLAFVVNLVLARLTRLRQELAAFDDDAVTDVAPTLPAADDVVTATEDDPDTPEATFPVGYGSIKVG